MQNNLDKRRNVSKFAAKDSDATDGTISRDILKPMQ